MISSEWTPNQPNTILFVLLDSSGSEFAGLGTGFVLKIKKPGGSFTLGSGTKSESEAGWYQYVTTAAEADTPGPIAIYITGAGIVQQNLEYVVGTRVVGATGFTYTLTNSGDSSPIVGARVWITTDVGGTKAVWNGTTDSNGVAKDLYGNLPLLSPGSYYFWKQKTGILFAHQPDLETVS